MVRRIGAACLACASVVLVAAGCARRGADVAHHTGVEEPLVRPAVPAAPVDPAPREAGTFALPHTPAGCDYAMPSVSPGHPRLVPHTPTLGAAPRPRNLHLTFVGDASTTMVVQWSTDVGTLASEVRFGPEGGALDQVAHGYSFVYGGGAGRREHEVHLCGLEPGRRYQYTAGGGTAVSPTHAFGTAPSDQSPVRVMVAGDSRSNPQIWGQVAARALLEHPDVMLFTGDAVNDGANQSRWDAFFDAAPEFLASVPSLWADGNHEGIAEVYFAQFAFPDNGQAHRHEHWYTLRYGPLEVIVLNDTTVPPSEIQGIERDFLRRSLAAVARSVTPWVVAVHHQPIYTTSIGHLPDEVTHRAWVPLFDEFHLDLDLTGHVHNYESSLPIHGGQVTDDAHGTRYFGYGGGGAPLYHFLPRTPWVLTRESTYGFALMTVGAHTLEWDARRIDGSRIETIAMAK